MTRELFKDREFTPAREEVMMSSIIALGTSPLILTLVDALEMTSFFSDGIFQGEAAVHQGGVRPHSHDVKPVEEPMGLFVLSRPSRLQPPRLGFLSVLALFQSHSLPLPEEQGSSGGAEV